MTAAKTPVSTYKQPALRESGLTIVGTVKFSNLKEPRKMPQADDKELAYEITLTFDPSDDQVAKIEALNKDAIEAETELLPAHKRRNVVGKKSMFREDVDRDKNPTGLLALTIKKNARKRVKGELVEVEPPTLIGVGGETLDFNFVRQGSKVEVTFNAASYNISTAGVSLRMTQVKILEEAGRVPAPKVDVAKIIDDEDSVL